MLATSPALLQINHRFGICYLGMLLGVLACVGCDDGQPFDYVSISGRITYEDGETLPVDGTLRLTFYSDAPPVDERFYPRPGTAFPDENGDFSEAMTMRPGDGLIPGTHHVTVGYMGRSTEGILPEEYTLKKKTPLVVGTSQQPFDIKIPRP